MTTPEQVTVIPTLAVLLDHDDTGIITRSSEYAHMIRVGELLGLVGSYAVTKTVLDESWGLPFDEQFSAVYGRERAAEAIQTYHDLTAQFPRQANPGYLALLDQFDMKCMPYGIVSHHNGAMIREELPLIGADPGKHVLIHGAEDLEGRKKPDGRVFMPALRFFEQFGIYRDKITYIGDDERDMRAAADADMQFIGVTTGIQSAEEFDEIAAAHGLPRPNVVSSLEEITVGDGKLIIPARAALAA